MPIIFSSRATVDVWLASDKDISPDKRPMFTARALTARQELEVVKEINAALASGRAGDGQADLEHALAAMRVLFVGWKNLPGHEKFDPGAFADILSTDEMWELIGAARRGAALGSDDLKNSESRSGSEPAASADSAKPGV